MSRALVLSGGGLASIAWQSGLVSALSRRGVAVADADLIVGTSAGAVVGAHVSLGRDMDALVGGLVADRPSAQPDPPWSRPDFARRMQQLVSVQTSADLRTDAGRAVVGRFALDLELGSEEEFVATFSHLKGEVWPASYACTAVDALTGALIVWDSTAGEDLDRAVASSCALPGMSPPITLAGRRYMDGGMRSGTNADVARGYDVVLILTILGKALSSLPGADVVLRQMEEERAVLSGSRVLTIGPDEESEAAMGLNMMDSSVMPVAAEAGARQGDHVAKEVQAFFQT